MPLLAPQVVDPINNPGPWSVIYIGDTPSPGIIEQDGIEGFDRETGWDEKRTKGAAGATLTLVQAPPARGSFTFVLWDPIHWVQWALFVPLLNYTPTKTQSQAVGIYHPALSDIGVSAVVTKKIGKIRHVGKNKYLRTIEFIEWVPPPKQSAVTTPTRAQQVTDPNTPGLPPDPIADEQQKQIAQLLQQAAAP